MLAQAYHVAGNLNVIKYMECSARTGGGVTELFDFVIKAALEKRRVNDAVMARVHREHQLDKHMDRIGDTMKMVFSVGKDKQ